MCRSNTYLFAKLSPQRGHITKESPPSCRLEFPRSRKTGVQLSTQENGAREKTPSVVVIRLFLGISCIYVDCGVINLCLNYYYAIIGLLMSTISTVLIKATFCFYSY